MHANYQLISLVQKGHDKLLGILLWLSETLLEVIWTIRWLCQCFKFLNTISISCLIIYTKTITKIIFISNCLTCKRNSLVLFVNVRVISGYLQHVINVVVERYNFFHCKNKNKVSFFTPIHAVSLSLSLSLYCSLF